MHKIHPALKTNGAELVPVIIEYADGVEPGKKMLKNLGCRSRHKLKALNGISADCPADAIKQIAEIAEVNYVWEDEVLSLTLDSSVPLINATRAWNDFGDGAGINVSIIDSGINTSHPGLAGQVILENDFTPEGILDDRCNHGTPVACIVGCINDTYKGVAPGVKMFNAKVARVVNENPLQCGVLSSDAIAAIDWSVEHGAQVIQMSVGSDVSSCYQGALAVAVNNSGKNITIVVPAGNGGPGNQSIWTPGCAENALTVGASDGSSIASFSSRGPTDYGLIKPDLVAPGVSIVSANNDGTSFSSHSGTSFASPHVSGVVALMLQQNFFLPPWLVKEVLKNISIDLGYDANTQGAGRVDAWAAVNLASTVVVPPLLTIIPAVPSGNTVAKTFVINATIRNTGGESAENVTVVLSVPEGLSILDGAERAIGLICPSNSAFVNWTVNASEPGNFSANITVVAENAPESIEQFIISVEPAIFSIVLQPGAAEGKDSYISSSSPNKNYGEADPLKVQTNSLRALIWWNLSSIPANAVIDSAIMQLYVPSVQKTANNTVSAYRLTRQWYENNVTWKKYDGAHTWTSAGGDYSSTIWASALVGASGTYYSWDVTQLVKSWLNNTYQNYGIIMISQSSNNCKDISSSDCTTGSRRPALLINYTT